MISILLVAGIAYGIAYWISLTGLAYWRAFVGFMLGFSLGWFGGSVVSALLISQFFSLDISAAEKSIFLKSTVWALLGAGYGVYRARFKLKTGNTAPPFALPKWVLKVVGGMAVIGIAAAVGIPAYQDYAKGQAKPIAFGENDKIVNEPAVSPTSSVNPPSFGANDAVISPPVKGQSGTFDEHKFWANDKPADGTLANEPTEKKFPEKFVPFNGKLDSADDGVSAFKRGDYATAVRIFRFLADQGDAESQWSLAWLYTNGQGVVQDDAEASKWFRLAAQQGHAGGQIGLGMAYADGRGLHRDQVKALMWQNLGALSGNPFMVDGRDRLAQSMTPQQVAQAQKIARECQQRNFKGCD